MIAISCPQCDAKLKVKDDLAGKKVRCPTCRQAVAVPSLTVAFEAGLPPQGSPRGSVADDATVAPRAPSNLDASEPITGPPVPSCDGDVERVEAKTAYSISSEIARGGMGAIMRAVDGDIQREVAVKFLLNQADAKQKARFLEEAQITGQLEHPNIVPIHQLGVGDDGRCFFSMKMVQGQSLADLLKDDTVMMSRLLTVFVGICNGMAYAHSRKVVHRDLKPANVMVGDFGEVYVMDWGLAKVVTNNQASGVRQLPASVSAPAKSESGDSRPPLASLMATTRAGIGELTQAGAILGTPSYMPPEQARGEEVDERADIYSLGAILYEMLTRTPPVGRGGDMLTILMRVVEGQIDQPVKRAPDCAIPAELSAIAMKALSLRREDRYQSTESLQRDIQLFLEGRSVSAKQDSALELLKKLIKRNKGFSIATAAAILIVTILSSIFLKVNYDARVRAENAQQSYLKEQQQKETAIRHALPALGQFARQLASEGKIDQAKSQIDLTLLYDAKDPEALLLQSELLLAEERWAEGQALLDRYLQQRPSDADAGLLRELSERGQANDPSVWFDLATLLQRRKLLAPAAPLFAKVQQNKKDREPLLALYTKQVKGHWPDSPAVGINAKGMLHFSDLNGGNRAHVLPLKGIPLESAVLRYWKKLQDLEGLRGMPLVELHMQYAESLSDLSLLRGMPLARLEITFAKSIKSLEPLRGMQLTDVNLVGCSGITDLNPLQGMPIRKLGLKNCAGIVDLAPLKGMPLTELDLGHCTLTTDLEPLHGMRLTRLEIQGMKRVKTLEPLRGMPLTYLDIYGCSGIDSLEPLRGMPLAILGGLETLPPKVTDLEPLRGMPFKSIGVTGFPDLSPLEGMPLELVVLTPKLVRKGMDILRRMTTLQRIQALGTYYPAEEFWRRYDAGEFTK